MTARNDSETASVLAKQKLLRRLRRIGAALMGMLVMLSCGRGLCEELLVYVGTYTGGKSEGIYILRMDLTTGALTNVGVARGVKNPSFIAIHPNQRFLYAVNEIGDFGGANSGAVSALALNQDTGTLTLLNQAPSQGAGPCHLVVDREGKHVLVANYGGGSVAVLPIDENGKLGPATAFIQHKGASVNRQRQRGPHAHCVTLDAANRFAFVADLGLDKVLVYRFDATRGTLTPNQPSAAALHPGAGPRHFAFHPSGKYAYVINEIDCTMTAFSYDANRGILDTIQTVSTLPKGLSQDQGRGRYSTAEVEVHPSGRFVYGSNRGHDSIVAYAIDVPNGTLTHVEHEPTQGKTPRSFGIDPTGTYLLAANQGSDSIVVFRINQTTGELEPAGQTIQVPTPVCVKMVRFRN